VTGYVCGDNAAFVECVRRLKQSPNELEVMRMEARRQAEGVSWDSVFSAVYRAYEVALQPVAPLEKTLNMKLGASAAAKT